MKRERKKIGAEDGWMDGWMDGRHGVEESVEGREMEMEDEAGDDGLKSSKARQVARHACQ